MNSEIRVGISSSTDQAFSQNQQENDGNVGNNIVDGLEEEKSCIGDLKTLVILKCVDF